MNVQENTAASSGSEPATPTAVPTAAALAESPGALVSLSRTHRVVLPKRIVERAAEVYWPFLGGRFRTRVEEGESGGRWDISDLPPVSLPPDMKESLQSKHKQVMSKLEAQTLGQKTLALRQMAATREYSDLWDSLPDLLAVQRDLATDCVFLCTHAERPYLKAIGLTAIVVGNVDSDAGPRDSLARDLVWLKHLNSLARVASVVAPGLFIGLLARTESSWAPYLRMVATTAPAWGTALAILAAGLGLYWVRCRARVLYGTVECCLGVWLAYRSLPQHLDEGWFLTMLPALVSLYVVVRGFDNIGKGLERRGGAPRWRAFFHGSLNNRGNENSSP